jgi:hypothetical protein
MASLGGILKGTVGAAYRGTKTVAGGVGALAMSSNPDALAAGFMTAQASRAVGAVKSGVVGGVKGAFNKAFGGGSGGSGATGSPTRSSGEQPLTEKTFQDFSNKMLAYTQSLVNMSNKELDAIQDQELRTREMLAEGTGKESIASRVARGKKKPEGMTLLKMLGLGALAVALAGGGAAGAGEGGEGGGIPFIIPPPFLPKPKPKPGRTPKPKPGRAPQPKPKPGRGGSVPRAGGGPKLKPGSINPKTGRVVGVDGKDTVNKGNTDQGKKAAEEIKKKDAERPKVEKKPPGAEPKAGAPEKKRVNKEAIKKAAKKVVGGIAKRVLPGIGVAYGLYDAVEDASKGDLFGALRAAGIAAGSLASMIPFLAPVAVPATAAGVIADLIIDLKNDPELQGASQKDIEDAAKEVVDEYFEKLSPLGKRDTAKVVAEQLEVAEAGKKTGQRLRGRTRDMSPAERKALFEQQKKDRAAYKEAGGKKGTGVSFEKFAAGQQDVREKQIQMDIDASVEAEEAMGSPPPTAANTLSSERGNVEPVRTDTSDVTLQRSSSGMSALRQRAEEFAAFQEAENDIQVAGATSVDVGSEEVDVAGYDRSRAESKVDTGGQENLRISRLLPNSMNSDSTMNKAIGKALSTTA